MVIEAGLFRDSLRWSVPFNGLSSSTKHGTQHQDKASRVELPRGTERCYFCVKINVYITCFVRNIKSSLMGL